MWLADSSGAGDGEVVTFSKKTSLKVLVLLEVEG